MITHLKLEHREPALQAYGGRSEKAPPARTSRIDRRFGDARRSDKSNPDIGLVGSECYVHKDAL
jgi:hypothetical protein